MAKIDPKVARDLIGLDRFKTRVRSFAVAQAAAVLAEDGSTPKHAERVVYARRVLTLNGDEVDRIIIIGLALADVPAETAALDTKQLSAIVEENPTAFDTLIQTMLAGLWNTLAGVDVNGS